MMKNDVHFIDAYELNPGDLYVDSATGCLKMIVSRADDHKVCIIYQSGRIVDNLIAIATSEKVNQ